MATCRLAFLLVFAAAVSYTDLRYRKVPNRLILFATVAGIALAAAGGWNSLRCGLSGMALGYILLIPAFLLRMVGGGDVKSLAVIGLAGGPGLLWTSFLRGAAAGGLAALLILCARRWGRNPESTGGAHGCASPPTLPYAAILCASAVASALLAWR